MQKSLAVLLLLVSSMLSAETITFDIKVFGSKVGKMEVSHNKDADGTEVYTIESNSCIKFLWVSKTYQSHFEARFRDGIMISSVHTEREGGKSKRWSTVKYDGHTYWVDSDKGKRSFTEAITLSDISLYFSPDFKKLMRLFYLPDASFNDVKHTDKNTIEFKSADGHRNVYFFENGKMTQMEFHLAMATVYMTRVN